jgi:hypothetical protein
VAADRFFTIGDAKSRTPYFLEAGRGTMTLERLTRKLMAYAADDKAGKYRKKFSIRNCRVLTVTSSAARMQMLHDLTSGQADLSALNPRHP